MRRSIVAGIAAVLCSLAVSAIAQCPPGIDGSASSPLQPVSSPAQCTTQIKNGFPIPDPNCTPGAINPTLTVDVLRDPNFRTACVRSHATTESQKASTYALYGIPHPSNNTGASQTCELDHLISLELGGADTLDNIWPQCGPSGATLSQRFFKEKDGVENYLARLVKDGQIDLSEAQRGIATDWTQYLDAARRACPGGQCQ
jgi:hypothetical protein